MSVSDKPSSSVRDLDPLLKDLSEKKLTFRRSLVSLAAEVKDVRSRLASQEESFARETLTRQAWILQVAETRAKGMEEEIFLLQKSLEERNEQLQVSASTAKQVPIIAVIDERSPEKCVECKKSVNLFAALSWDYLEELDDLRSQLSSTQATADASAISARSAQLHCVALLKELDDKNSSIKEHEDRVNRLGEQVDHLQKDLQVREVSQKQLKDEILRIERDIMQAVAKASARKDCELQKILDKVSPKHFDKINKLLTVKDEEIAKLRDEIRIMSSHWKLKTKEFESQLEKHWRADQELKKRVLKLEFCLQEARSQTRKFQRMGERRNKALKELRDQLAMKQQERAVGIDKQNFWESSGFKIVASISMLIVVVFGRAKEQSS
ncbi:hypothetical protein HHK36_020952 [Tetracentron sinense]|uniref:Uncharacterized protein n=1 Tax=Tetracentron sinense TaxID=13715 RepID=A0A834YW28_TETSI|nr:hypothetical protein HHK36_020952 [Tetracentron sinense]